LVEIYSLVHAESLDEAIDGSHLTRLVAWDEEASVDLFRLNADSGSEATVGSVGFIDVRLAAGTLHTDGGAASRVFLALMLDAHLPLEEQGQPQFRGTQLVPIDTHRSVESARELVDMGIGLAEQFSFTPLESGEFVAEARGGSGGSGGLACMNSNWVGTNGVQCCVNHAIYGEAKAACWSRLLSGLFACFRDHLVGSGAIITACAAMAAPCLAAGGPKAYGVCFLACVGVGAVGLLLWSILCLAEKAADTWTCLNEASAQYMRDLRDSGCWPPPEGFEP